ncbi:MAG TPA: PIN domain-containing protein [Planctomycetota bacterium]|nr:PIN domain-containing protein [Planctomycetota bacterium]
MPVSGSAKTEKKRPYKRQFLVFVDTNIFLDFYKTSQLKGLTLLSHLDRIRDRVVTTEQVAMEFKKNRQNVILDTMTKLQAPGKISPPLFLANATAARALSSNIEKAVSQIKRMKEKLLKVLSDPKNSDEVYRVAQKQFDTFTELNLHRRNKATAQKRFMIRRLARKRFQLGYPPRKPDDTSMGDAINWEWIIHCAQVTQKHVVIVSRDSDYGGSVNDSEVYINDWLREEFHERTSPQRQIRLTRHLAHALRLAGVAVTQKEEAVERNVVQEADQTRAQVAPHEPGSDMPLTNLVKSLLLSAPRTGKTEDEWFEAVKRYFDKSKSAPGGSTPDANK